MIFYYMNDWKMIFRQIYWKMFTDMLFAMQDMMKDLLSLHCAAFGSRTF